MEKDFAQKLTALVGTLEQRSAAEVVVVLARRSGSYQDIEHILAFAGSLLWLLHLIHTPIEVNTDLWVLWLVLAYLFTLALVRHCPDLWRAFTPRARLRAQAVRQAHLAFVEERVASTRERTGLLVYLSELEREVVLIGDLGIERALPMSHFHELERNVYRTNSWSAFQAKLLSELAALEEPLATALPAAADDTNELDNEIRVRR